jgi:hypothetical protein
MTRWIVGSAVVLGLMLALMLWGVFTERKR